MITIHNSTPDEKVFNKKTKKFEWPLSLITARNLIRWASDDRYVELMNRAKDLSLTKLYTVSWPDHVADPQINGDCTIHEFD